jgi:hypothetical protein
MMPKGQVLRTSRRAGLAADQIGFLLLLEYLAWGLSFDPLPAYANNYLYMHVAIADGLHSRLGLRREDVFISLIEVKKRELVFRYCYST